MQNFAEAFHGELLKELHDCETVCIDGKAVPQLIDKIDVAGKLVGRCHVDAKEHH